ITARAQQGDRVRRIGVLMPTAESDPEAKARLSGFTQGLAESDWTDGRNLRMDVRWAAGNVDLMRTFAKELVDLRPEMIFAATPLSLSPKSVNSRQGEPQLTDQIGYAVGVPLNERHFRG